MPVAQVENDNSSIYASVSFDAFVWELFPYITAGASVHVLNHETRLDVEKLNRYFHEPDACINRTIIIFADVITGLMPVAQVG